MSVIPIEYLIPNVLEYSSWIYFSSAHPPLEPPVTTAFFPSKDWAMAWLWNVFLLTNELVQDI